jgi:molybdopterin-biosynthesis enzyme MoeA-like protein
LIKDVQREEGKLLETMKALNSSQKDDNEMQKQLEQMIIDFKREETKLKKSLKELQDKNDEDSKDLRDQVDDLENRIKLEQLNSQKAINDIEGQHEV